MEASAVKPVLCAACSLPAEETATMTDGELLMLANKKRENTVRLPSQSFFRVSALMVCIDNEASPPKPLIIEGHNHESGYIGGSICAERSAIGSVQFRKLIKPTILKVFISTDSLECIAPGCLCREYMSSFSTPETLIVMANADMSKTQSVALSDLYPAGYLYGKLDRTAIEPFALSRGIEWTTPNDENDPNGHFKAYTSLYDAAKRAALTLDSDVSSRAGIHPVHLGAAAATTDGRTLTAGMLKGLEYGCTLDPVTALLPALVEHVRAGEGTLCRLVLCDQYGVLHAPFGQARALLNEHGFGHAELIYHDGKGTLFETTVSSLVPPICSDGGHSGLLSFEADGFVQNSC